MPTPAAPRMSAPAMLTTEYGTGKIEERRIYDVSECELMMFCCFLLVATVDAAGVKFKYDENFISHGLITMARSLLTTGKPCHIYEVPYVLREMTGTTSSSNW
jgi:hypothetical protein